MAGGDRAAGAGGRAALGPVSAGGAGRDRDGGAGDRAGTDGDAARGGEPGRHRVADGVVRGGVWVLSVAEPAGDHVERAGGPERGASGIVATSRLLGQSTGAALVALSFGVAG